MIGQDNRHTSGRERRGAREYPKATRNAEVASLYWFVAASSRRRAPLAGRCGWPLAKAVQGPWQYRSYAGGISAVTQPRPH